jgi:hypothetical protein
LSISSAPSSASENMRPIAFRGFEIESPVRCNNFFASIDGKDRGVAGSSPKCGDGCGTPGIGSGLRRGVVGSDEDDEDDDEIGGDRGREVGND